MKKYYLLLATLFVFAGCGGGSSSTTPACAVNASCSTQCSGTGYSSDGGTNCFSDSSCQTSCSHSQTERLRITNNCSYTIWIQQQNMPSSVPSVVQLTAGSHYDFNIPAAGQASTRFWPKTGCDSTGENCTIGQSSDPCPTGGCPPPVDSKLESTWGCTLSDQTQCGTTAQGGVIGDTYWNMSAVDGYTLPFIATVTGNTVTDESASCQAADCSALTLSECPTADNLSVGRNGATYSQYSSANLKTMNSGSSQIGCYSPCKWFNYPTFGGQNQAENSDPPIMYCCPTPIANTAACEASPSTCVTSAQCRTGPVAGTQYVSLIHSKCSNTVYSYAYDDGYGLRHCSAGTLVSVVFGPNCP